MKVTRDYLSSLVDISLDALTTMFKVDAGLFCQHRDRFGRQHGVSPRYSLICLIGLHRASEAGYSVPFDVNRILRVVLDRASPTPADSGLRLWASALYRPESGRELLLELETQLSSQPPAQRTGMHAGLALSGLVAFAELSGGSDVVGRAASLRERIIEDYGGSPSGLFYHSPPGSLRRSKPNFATQAYLTYSLARESTLSGDPSGADLAERCVRALASLQRSDGGWPWIYDTYGSVVEDYEIYSVHQDAMGPMAFLAVDDAGRNGYRHCVVGGLEWMTGRNQLGVDMVNRESLLIYRSIRRPQPLDKIVLTINTAAVGVSRLSPFHDRGRVELNATCRPYHPGWVLETWSGRIDRLD